VKEEEKRKEPLGEKLWYSEPRREVALSL